MKKFILILFSISFAALFSISIHDIQYTTISGPNGTYPSPYEGQIVTTGGIVSATDFNNGRFFIASSDGGDWNGIYVYDNDQNVAVGDSVIIEAEVYEYWGFTELSNLNSCTVISSGNIVPPNIPIDISEVETEAYESVRIFVSDVTVSQTYDEWGQWKVTDGSSECIISTGFINLEEQDIPIIEGYPIDTITGFVTYFWEEFQLNPVSINSIYSFQEDHIISVQDQLVFSPEEFEIPIYHTVFNDGLIQSYQFELQYNPQVIEYSDYEITGTLSANGTIEVEQSGNGNILATYNGNSPFENMETLLKLKFTGIESGSTNLEFSEFLINNNTVEYFSTEEITLQLETIQIGDTLTVIQRPIMNIPQITIPNEEFIIECLADEATTNWSAELVHSNKTVSLSIINSVYDSDLERWKLIVSAPTPDIYELYNLVVSADGIVTDTAKNAVHIIPERKTDYSFVHITDTHLPTHIFYPDPLSLTDSTEVEDLREVIKDINLIHPEFVLLTGDLVNEGEMEDFENRRVYTKAQKILEELEVPLYLTSGNHDLGGWDSTPPSQGTARRDWWRFFGWNWLLDPPAVDPYYTQNYSFDYGPIHFIGLEAYLNYDSYLYYIYGGESFTDLQMQWLEDDLQEHSASLTNVVFYHYDFSDQINLNNLGIDMALYGHNHSNTGNLTNPPYNISTKSTCDGNRSYRMINVDDAVLQPTETIYAGWSGNQLQTTFTPNNIGTADSVYCYIENEQNLNFPDAQLKFIMPAGAEEYTAIGGMITQIDETGEFTVCYINCEIPANGNISVSLVANFNVSSENILDTSDMKLTNYPNPFNPSTTISFELNTDFTENTELIVYNLKGQKVKSFLINTSTAQPINSVVWNGTDDNDQPVSSGIYFIKLKNGKLENTKKIMLMK